MWESEKELNEIIYKTKERKKETKKQRKKSEGDGLVKRGKGKKECGNRKKELNEIIYETKERKKERKKEE